MKNVAGLLVLSLMAVSCIDLKGSLNVNQVMSAEKKGGFLNLQTKTIQIQPGSYDASLKVNNAKSFTLKFKSTKEDESDILIPIKSKKEFSLPSNGPVVILGSDIAQPFDIGGNIQTNVTESNIVKTMESCTFNVKTRRCEQVCTEERLSSEEQRKIEIAQRDEAAANGSRPVRVLPTRIRCDVVCNDVLVPVNGSRYVEYHKRYTQRNLTANLVQQDSKTILATFSGEDTDSYRINDYFGECR